MRPALLAALLVPLALPAQAQEGGTLTLVTDGQTVAYDLWSGQSDWSGSEAWASVNIYARPAEEGTDFGILTLGFEVVGGAGQNGEVSLSREEGGERVKLFGEDEQGGLTLTVDAFSVDGDFATLTGSYTSQVGPSENYGRDIDLSEPLAVEGTFEVTLGPV